MFSWGAEPGAWAGEGLSREALPSLLRDKGTKIN